MTVSKDGVEFRAEIAWLGPIMGAPFMREGVSEVTIAGAEDPALGKAFCAALVPVVADLVSNRYRRTQPYRRVEPTGSDRNGWFHVRVGTNLWKEGADGVLLVLLYNRSINLRWYTFDNFPSNQKPDVNVPPRDPRRHTAKQSRLPPMPQGLPDAIITAIDPAIDELLDKRGTIDSLRKGLAEIRNLKLPLSPHDPDPGDAVPLPSATSELVIAVASCQYPSSIFENDVAGASYMRLGERLASEHSPQSLLLVGDQIYTDATAGLFDPTSQFDRYVRPYEILFQMDAARDVLRRLPSFMMLDDHEIVDNWEPKVDDKRTDPAMIDGSRAYRRFERRHGPELHEPVADSRHPLWYPFRVNGFPFFMTDTRTERTWRTAAGIATSKIMSDGQRDTLCTWLQNQPREVPKVVASPAILLPRHARAIQRGHAASALRSDSWDGFPTTMREVLACIAECQIPNVVFVSGDEHLSCVARVEIEAQGYETIVIHSVHSSPLYAPFPFANSQRADLVANDNFLLDAIAEPQPVEAERRVNCGDRIGRLCCHVETEFGPPGDGFSVLRFSRSENGWTMSCDFDRAKGSVTIVRTLT
jgi:hypothetical protein